VFQLAELRFEPCVFAGPYIDQVFDIAKEFDFCRSCAYISDSSAICPTSWSENMQQKIGVTTRALIQRINRKLKYQDEAMRATRGERARQDYGDYFIVSNRNEIVDWHVDPEERARELGVMADWEVVAP
jgi:hypothetical protein